MLAYTTCFTVDTGKFEFQGLPRIRVAPFVVRMSCVYMYIFIQLDIYAPATHPDPLPKSFRYIVYHFFLCGSGRGWETYI